MTAILRHVVRQRGYGIEALRLFEAMTVKPDGRRKALIADTIKALQASGVWNQQDAVYFMAAHDAQAARLNWKNPSLFAMTAVNSPTFTRDRGYQGDGATSYLNTNLSSTTAGINFSQNNASFSFFTVNHSTPTTSNGNDSHGYADTVGLNSTLLRSYAGSTFMAARVAANVTANTSLTVGTHLGFRGTSRDNASTYNALADANPTTTSQTSTTLTANNFFVGALNLNGAAGQFSGGQMGFLQVGGDVGRSGLMAMRTIVGNYMRAIGAA